ncbi:MAG: orotidine-5'-phosphate decarboxylase [Phycisphaerales bacterium]
MHFAELLARRIDATRSVACVGLDPVLEQLPADLRARHHEPLAAIHEFCHGVVHAAAPHAAAVKFQSACFERYGAKGVAVLEDCIAEAARAGLTVVLDVKRGDIGITAGHYAEAARRTGAHAVTLSGYMGPSTITPFLDAGLGAFVLVRTSNPDSDVVQSQRLADGRSVAEAMADMVCDLAHARLGPTGLSSLGAVVGATKAGDAAALRARMPHACFLVPGYGAQGGTAEDIRAMVRRHDGSPLPGARAGVLVTASRSVIYAPPSEGSWLSGVSAAASRLTAELRAVVAP